MYLTQLGVTLFVSPVKWVVILAPLAMVFVLSFGMQRMRPATAQVMFWLFAALIGLSLGSIFMVYTHTSITRVFFITAASFGALSLWGYSTQRDLSGMGSFLIMGLFGVILASLVNLFLQAPMLQFVISDCWRAGVRGLDRVRHPAAEERISLRRDGRRDHGALGDHGRTVALSQLHQPVHPADAASRPARRVNAFAMTTSKAPASTGAFFWPGGHVNIS